MPTVVSGKNYFSLFLESFRLLGGKIHEREATRYEITHVPALIRSRDRLIGRREPVLQRYERITFEKNLIGIHGKPMASFVCPGHPLLDATIDLILERHRDLLKRGAVLIDPTDQSDEARVLFYLENSIQDARTDKDGNRRIISRQMHFVEINKDSQAWLAGYAPYLDYRPATPEEQRLIEPILDQSWLRKELESEVMSFAVSNLVSNPPVAIGGVMVIPQGLLTRLKGDIETQPDDFARETAQIEKTAMESIMQIERQLGYEPRDVSAMKCGYDIESRIPDKGCLRFIEVKGRMKGAKTVKVRGAGIKDIDSVIIQPY